jgi:hypothetical protein
MLKLEKTSNLSGLVIRMRERERFFEPCLLKALAIALFLHISALTLFHVTPFYLPSTFTFPPIQVQSDQPIQAISALVSSYPEEEELSPPPLSLVPTLDWVSFSQESMLIPSLSFDLHALQSLEERVWPKWQEPLSLKLEEPRIQLTISGDLAELPLIASDLLLNQLQPISHQELAAYVTYQVQLDEKTGEIFWYERTQSSAKANIDYLTEKILLNLRFASPASHEIVKGAVNFVVLASEEEG